MFEKYGIGELIFTSDGGLRNELLNGTLPGVFETVNFQDEVEANLEALKKHQPGLYPSNVKFSLCYFHTIVVSNFS